MLSPPAAERGVVSFSTVVGLAILAGAFFVQMAYDAPERDARTAGRVEAVPLLDGAPATCPRGSGWDSLDARDVSSDSALEAAVHVVRC